MGYDPYDYYDLGEFDQRDRADLFSVRAQSWINSLKAHAQPQAGCDHADIVINHNSGADAQEVNPITGQSRWTFQSQKRKVPA